MNFTLVNSLILAGIIQGFLFGLVYLLSPKYRNKSTLFLALLIISFSYNNLQFYLADARIISGSEMYRTFYIPVGSLIPVFIYFYSLESTVGLHSRFKKSWLFFIPFILFLTNAFFFKIYNLVTTMSDEVYLNFRMSNNFQSVFSLVYTLVLIGLSYKHLVAYEQALQTKESRGYDRLSWLKKTLVLLFFLSLFWSVALFMFFTNDEYTIYFNLLWVGLSVAIYWLGHIGIYRYGVTQERRKIRSFSTARKATIVVETRGDDNVTLLKEKLIEQQHFLDSGLTLELLATDVGVSKSHLSRIFNSELKTSFSDYVNRLRVEEAKSYLINPEFSKYTLVAIGLEAGFNSKTTFNTAFKKFTGKTPSQYRNDSKTAIEVVPLDR